MSHAPPGAGCRAQLQPHLDEFVTAGVYDAEIRIVRRLPPTPESLMVSRAAQSPPKEPTPAHTPRLC
jgi:hypothetical protein